MMISSADEGVKIDFSTKTTTIEAFGEHDVLTLSCRAIALGLDEELRPRIPEL